MGSNHKLESIMKGLTIVFVAFAVFAPSCLAIQCVEGEVLADPKNPNSVLTISNELVECDPKGTGHCYYSEEIHEEVAIIKRSCTNPEKADLSTIRDNLPGAKMINKRCMSITKTDPLDNLLL